MTPITPVSPISPCIIESPHKSVAVASLTVRHAEVPVTLTSVLRPRLSRLIIADNQASYVASQLALSSRPIQTPRLEYVLPSPQHALPSSSKGSSLSQFGFASIAHNNSPRGRHGVVVFSPMAYHNTRWIKDIKTSSFSDQTAPSPTDLASKGSGKMSPRVHERKRLFHEMGSPTPSSPQAHRDIHFASSYQSSEPCPRRPRCPSCTSSRSQHRSRTRSSATRTEKARTRRQTHSHFRSRSQQNNHPTSRLDTQSPLPAPPQPQSKSNPPPPAIFIAQPPHPLLHSLSHLRTNLVPLISITTGLSHPEFPTSLLQYHLLTHDQLDSLARWYHQTTDAGPERYMYPSMIERAWLPTSTSPAATAAAVTTTQGPISSTTWQISPEWDDVISTSSTSSSSSTSKVKLEAKRRRFGRFIGLQGCESPVIILTEGQEEDQNADAEGSTEEHEDEEEEDVRDKMEREWRAMLRRAEEERMMAEKAWRGKW